MSTKPRLRSASGAYAVFCKQFPYEEIEYFRQKVQFWMEQEDGTWAGMVAHDRGVTDASKFTNFVRYESRATPA